MTQEELDALMSGGMDDIHELEDELTEDDSEEENLTRETEVEEESQEEEIPADYADETAHQLPMPATNENKMVHQLDEVTKESEEKAIEIFDIIEGISNDLMEKEGNSQRVIEALISNIELFKNLNTKFPDVAAFKTQLEVNEAALLDANEELETLQTSGDSIMSIMDIMQYQDIHRQKIERVINVMRALSRYMNTLFEGKIDDDKRVSSAQHIAGDNHTNLASTDDIEALLEQFGQ